MKLVSAVLCLLSSMAFAQSAVRYDNRVSTVATNVPVNATAPVLAVPNASVLICNDGACTSPASIFSNQGLSVPASNPLTTDGKGMFGFWATSGSYFYQVKDFKGNIIGTYPITLGGSGTGATLPSTPSIVKSVTSTTSTAAVASDVVGLFSSCTGTKVLAANGTCVANGAAVASQYKIGAFNQSPSGGTAGIGASNSFTDATGNPLTVPGNITGGSFNGTPDAQLAQTGAGNNGIANSLASPNTAVTVNQGYTGNEGNYSAPYRHFPFLGQAFPQTAPPFAANTVFYDNRIGSAGPYYTNPAPSVPANFLDIFSSDSTGTPNGNNIWTPLNSQWWVSGGGRNSAGNGQTDRIFNTLQYVDQSQGISGNQFLTCYKYGFGDNHCLEIDQDNTGSVVNGNDEASPTIRLVNNESTTPFYGTVGGTFAAGATFYPITKIGGSFPGEGGPAVFPPASPTVFHIVSDTPPSGAVAGQWTIDRSGTPDTFGLLVNAVATPILDNGATTAETIALSNLTAAINTSSAVCIADGSDSPESDIVASVGSPSGTSPNITQTVTVNMQKPRSAASYITQGTHACSGYEVLANRVANGTVAPLRNMFRIIGQDSATTVRYAASQWRDAPYMSFSTTTAAATGSTLTRNGSNQVTLTTAGNSLLLNNDCIKVTASDATYNGTFCSVVGNGTTLTWTNAGSASSTTTTAPIYIEAPSGFDSNAVIEMPMYNIVRPNNPATGSPSGTIVIEANNLTVATGQQIEAQHGNQVAGELIHGSIARSNWASASFGNPMFNLFWSGNVAPGASLFSVAATQPTSNYQGAGGTQVTNASMIRDSGTPVFGNWINGHGLMFNQSLFSTNDCGVVACSNPLAFFNFFSLTGNTTTLQLGWAPGSGDKYTLTDGLSHFGMLPQAADMGTNDGVTFTSDVQTTPTAITSFVKNGGVNVATQTLTSSAYSVHGNTTAVPAAFDTGSTVNSSLICTAANGLCAGTTGVVFAPSTSQQIVQPLGTTFSASSVNSRIMLAAAPTSNGGSVPWGTCATQLDCAQNYANSQAGATGNPVAVDMGAGIFQTCNGIREPTGGFWKVSYFGAGPGPTTIQASSAGGCAVAGAPLFNNTAGFGRFEVSGINFDANNIATTCHDGINIQSVIERDTDCHNPAIGLGSFVCTSDGTTGNFTGCSGTFPAVGNFVNPRFTRVGPPLTVTAVNSGAGTITVALQNVFGVTSGSFPPALTGGMYNFTVVDHVEGWGTSASFAEDSHIYDAVISGPYTTNVTFATLIVGFSGSAVTGLTCTLCGNYGSGMTDMVIGFNDPNANCTTLPVAHVGTMTGNVITTMVVDYGGNCTAAPYAWAAPSLQVPYAFKYALSDSTIDTNYAGAGKIGMYEIGGNTLVTHFHPTQTEVGFEGHGNVHYDSTEFDTIYQQQATFYGTSQDVITYPNGVTGTHVLPGLGSFYFANASSPVQFSSMGNMITGSAPAGYALFSNANGLVFPCGTGWPAQASTWQTDHIKAGSAVPLQAIDCMPAASIGTLTLTNGLALPAGSSAITRTAGDSTTAPATTAFVTSALTSALQRVASGWCTGVATSSTTIGIPGLGVALTTGACTGTRSATNGFMMDGAGTLSNLSMRCASTGVSSSSGVLTLNVTHAGTGSTFTPTGLTLTYGTSTASSVVKDTTHTFAYSDGDILTVALTTQATETLGTCNVSVNY